MVEDSERRAALQQRVAQLGEQFLQRTAKETILLREQVTKLAAGDSATLESVRQLTHKIHGSGSTLGFGAIGACAAELERLSEECLAAPALLAKSLAPLAQGITRLENEIVQARIHLSKTQREP